MKAELKERLLVEKSSLQRALSTAQSKQKSYENLLSRGVACIKPTYYGDVQETMENNARARYHWARWSIATRAIQRRFNRVLRLLASKEDKKTENVINTVFKEAGLTEQTLYMLQPNAFTLGTTTTGATMTWTTTTNTTGG